jgi:hypothetical protein
VNSNNKLVDDCNMVFVPSFLTVSWFKPPKNGWGSIIEPILVERKTKCYELRKKVIHEGYSQVTLIESKEAHSAAVSAINYIQIIVRVLF